MGIPLYLQVIRVILVSAHQTAILLRSLVSWIIDKLILLSCRIAAAAHRVHQITLPLHPFFHWIGELIFLAGAVCLFVILRDFFWM